MTEYLICTDCDNPAEVKKTRCAACLERNRLKSVRHRERNGQTAGVRGRPRTNNPQPQTVRAREYYERRRAAQGVSTWSEALIQRLKALGYSDELAETWYDATVRRYREHVAACVALECERIREPFEVFVREVVEAPTDAVRLSILAPMAMAEAPEPFREYPQYRSPVATAV